MASITLPDVPAPPAPKTNWLPLVGGLIVAYVFWRFSPKAPAFGAEEDDEIFEPGGGARGKADKKLRSSKHARFFPEAEDDEERYAHRRDNYNIDASAPKDNAGLPKSSKAKARRIAAKSGDSKPQREEDLPWWEHAESHRGGRVELTVLPHQRANQYVWREMKEAAQERANASGNTIVYKDPKTGKQHFKAEPA